MILDSFRCKLIETPPLVVQSKNGPSIESSSKIESCCFSSKDCEFSQFSEIDWYFVGDRLGNTVLLVRCKLVF